MNEIKFYRSLINNVNNSNTSLNCVTNNGFVVLDWDLDSIVDSNGAVTGLTGRDALTGLTIVLPLSNVCHITVIDNEDGELNE